MVKMINNLNLMSKQVRVFKKLKKLLKFPKYKKDTKKKLQFDRDMKKTNLLWFNYSNEIDWTR